MSKFLIHGGKTLNGKVAIKSAKNAVLPILSASVLCKDRVVLHSIPKLADIDNMCKILESIGCLVQWKGDTLIVDSSNLNSSILPVELTSQLRASFFMLGSLLSTTKKAKISYPGGCNIGNRPIDIHLQGLKSLGAEIEENHGFIICDGSKMHSGTFYLRFPSVGATENLMMSAVFLKGETIIQNCAKEPEIVDLQNFLNKMGAKISGAGSCEIKIKGVKKLHGIDYTPIGDRIVAGTYIIATLMCGGNVELTNINPNYTKSLIDLFNSNDCHITYKNDKIKVVATKRLKSIPFVETNPYPFFPTDMQPQLMALECVSNGSSVIMENMFETRFKHIPQLIKMGADISTKNNIAIITGKENLSGAEVEATDLRAGACLVLAGLKASGYTTITNIHHIDRGYESIEKDLSLLGADIKRIE